LSAPDSEVPIAPKVAIIAAMEREVPLLVKLWRRVEREHEGRRFTFYEGEHAVLICGGIGPVFARRATEAAIALYRCPLVISAGFAGALVPDLKVGQTVFPASVRNAYDGSRFETVIRDTKVGQTELARCILVSFLGVADKAQKASLAEAYGAHVVDMEAAAVAQRAEARNVPFMAAKAISDELNLPMPPMDQFVKEDGSFSTFRFLMHVLPRPRFWLPMLRLARNSRKAAHNLCLWLGNDVLWTTMTLRAFGKQQGTVLR
jgi:adenosylhomocysteine nucleosidase